MHEGRAFKNSKLLSVLAGVVKRVATKNKKEIMAVFEQKLAGKVLKI